MWCLYIISDLWISKCVLLVFHFLVTQVWILYFNQMIEFIKNLIIEFTRELINEWIHI